MRDVDTKLATKITSPIEPTTQRTTNSRGGRRSYRNQTTNDPISSDSVPEPHEHEKLSELIAKRINFTIPTAITQHTTGAKGIYLQMHEELPEPITFQQFQSRIQPTPVLDLEEFEQQSTPSLEVNQLERKYWKNILFNPTIYGSDIAGSLFDNEICKCWNLQNLNTVLQRQLIKHNMCIPGVSTPFLYVGSYKSTFCWHTEDMELASINYLHMGAPKTWYGIPMCHKAKFEDYVKSEYKDEFKLCSQALRHKQILLSPTVLHQHGIKVSRMTQEQGEFMITFPGSYHSGFNHGLNIAEATNFATASWIPVGRAAERCLCDANTVNINVDMLFSEQDSLNTPDDDENIDFSYYHQNKGDFQMEIDPALSTRWVTLRIKLSDLPEEHRSLFITPTPAPVQLEDEPMEDVKPVPISEGSTPADAKVGNTSPVSSPSVVVPPVEAVKTKKPRGRPRKLETTKTVASNKIEKKKTTRTKKEPKEKMHPLFQKFYSR